MPRRQSASVIRLKATTAYTAMYQTARMLAMVDSRSAMPVCMTRCAMRPAKSFWKNGQLWRMTCQWFCQRTRLVTPGMMALWRIATSTRITAGRTRRISATMPASSGHCSTSAC